MHVHDAVGSDPDILHPDHEALASPLNDKFALRSGAGGPVGSLVKMLRQHGQRPSDYAIAQQANKAMGYKVADGLRAEGVKADLWAWPDGTPAKMDFGQYLIDSGCF